MMRSSKKRLLALALALPAATPFAAGASELSYDYLELGYTRVTGSPKIDGATINGSVAIGDDFRLFGGYSDLDVSGFSQNFDVWNVGIGYHHALSDRSDLVANLGYQEARVSGLGSADGWFTEVGVRGVLAPNVEGHVLIGYEDSDVGSGEVFGRVGGQYKFSSSWGLSADVKFIDGDTVVFFGPRVTF